MTVRVGSLLVVDDDDANRDMLSRRLRRVGYEVDVACDGAEALEAVAARSFDLILLDVMMPGIDGYEVLRQIRQTKSPSELPVILATAKDQSEDLVHGLTLGANDYVTKPLDFLIVQARVATHLDLKGAFDQIRALERGLKERNRELEAINARISRELRAAARIQDAFLPHGSPEIPGLIYAWSFRPCEELAGDGLNVVKVDESRVGVYVLDVSGHGVASAMLSVSLGRMLAPATEAVSILVRRDGEGGILGGVNSPADVATRLDRLFPFDPSIGQYATLLYGIIDLSSREFRFTSAGHPQPVFLPKGGKPSLLEATGFPIGLAQGPYTEHKIAIHPGDRVVIYSDGAIESSGSAGLPFGTDRLMAEAERTADLPLEASVMALRRSVEEWCGAAGLIDDLSILAFEIRES